MKIIKITVILMCVISLILFAGIRARTGVEEEEEENPIEFYMSLPYEPKDDTVPPTLVLNHNERSLSSYTDTSKVNWSDFVASAFDYNGVDIKSRVSADVSQLDVTEPGIYPVKIYVTDFIGNRTEIETEFEVKKPPVNARSKQE